jgi:hypothetical protein
MFEGEGVFVPLPVLVDVLVLAGVMVTVAGDAVASTFEGLRAPSQAIAAIAPTAHTEAPTK